MTIARSISYYIVRGKYRIGKLQAINSQVTSHAAAITLVMGRARSWNPGAVLKLSVVAMSADSMINLRCFGIPQALMDDCL